MKLPKPLAIAALITTQAVMASHPASAQVPCSGHQMLPNPRPESSCLDVKPDIHPSPDGALRASIYPVEVDLYGTPDLESRVVLRNRDGKLLNSRSFGSARGTNGYYVMSARWSPDSQFFVFSLSSSGGHSPWSFPIFVFSRETSSFLDFSAMIGKKPTLSPDFTFVGPHSVQATTWEKEGSQTKVPITVDLAAKAQSGGSAD